MWPSLLISSQLSVAFRRNSQNIYSCPGDAPAGFTPFRIG